MRTLTAPQFSMSGLGDRLCALILLCVYARLHGFNRVRVPWPKYPQPENVVVPQFRFIDILYKHVVSHIKLPGCVELVDAEFLPITEAVFDNNLTTGNVDLTWLQQAYLPEFDLSTLHHTARSIISEFSFVDGVTNYVKSHLADRFVALHIRRTDKVRKEAVCHTLISFDQLSDLDKRTHTLIERALTEGHTHFLVCSDSDNDAVPYERDIATLGGHIVRLPKVGPPAQTYHELAAMSLSSLIIQSQKNSAFSNFAAVLRETPLWNVYREL